MVLLLRLCARSTICTLLLAALALVAGCTSGPDLGQVKGRVTLDGKPLKGATVMFLPAAGGRPGTATTNDDGQYELWFNRTDKGAMVGRHEVKISTHYPPTKVLDEAKGALVAVPERPEILPKRYHAETELTADVKAGLTICDFELDSK